MFTDDNVIGATGVSQDVNWCGVSLNFCTMHFRYSAETHESQWTSNKPFLLLVPKIM